MLPLVALTLALVTAALAVSLARRRRRQTVEDMTWTAQAACRDMPGDEASRAFFNPAGAQAGMAICRRCPVTSQCASFAIETGANFGVFGGTVPPPPRGARQGRAATTKLNVLHGR